MPCIQLQKTACVTLDCGVESRSKNQEFTIVDVTKVLSPARVFQRKCAGKRSIIHRVALFESNWLYSLTAIK